MRMSKWFSVCVIVLAGAAFAGDEKKSSDAKDVLRKSVQAIKDAKTISYTIAIEAEGAFAGSVGIKLGLDVERVSAEIGYWVAEPYWGRGIATAALVAATDWAFGEWPLTRIFAGPFARNARDHR